MKKYLTTPTMMKGVSLALIAVLAIGCATPTATPVTAPTVAPPTPASTVAPPKPTTPPTPALAGDLVRGGLLYDVWWEALGSPAPPTDQPLWQTQTTNARKGADTWRCKECHGWDYKGKDGAYGSGSHKTGFPGIFNARSKSATEIVAILKGSINPEHDFSKVLDNQSLIDLTLFITKAQIDDAELVNADKTPKGNAAAGKPQYEKVCINCHGPNGNAINFGSLAEPELVGHVAADSPWEFLHKIRFGQPGWPMPSGITNEWTQQDFANVLAYGQTLSKTPAVSGGGPLYDAWWEVIGAEKPTTDQPLWKTQTTNTRQGADTWRCKECHGWDYKGVKGAYGSGSHKTGFVGILDSASKSTDDLTAWLTGKKNPNHDFSKQLKDVQVKALVTFIQKELTDTAPFINADKTIKGGDLAKGKTKFNATCAACHGQDGKKINFGDQAAPEYVGTVAADNPWEFFHKVSLGQPGEPMPAGIALGWSVEDRINVMSYAQTLPTK